MRTVEKHTLRFLKKFLLCVCLFKLIAFSSLANAATNLNYNTASAANSDQYATGWRPYRPDIGRFSSLDPAGSPNGPNRYNYCGSEPVNHTDPTGLCPDCGHDSCLGDECHGDGVLRWKRTKPLLFWMDWNWEKRTNHDNAVDAHFRATVSQPAVQQHLDDATAIVVQTNVGKPVASALGAVKGSVTLLVTGPLVVAKNTFGTYTYWITGYCRDAYEDNANLGLGLANTVAHPVDTFFNTMSEVSNSRNAYSAGDIFGSSTMSWYMMGRGAQSLTATGLSKLRSLVPANVAEFTENLRAAAGVETRLVEVESAAVARGMNNPNVRAAAEMGNRVHYDKLNGGTGTQLPSKLRAEFIKTEFYFTGRGEKGVDVTVLGGTRPWLYPNSWWKPGNMFGDFKPNTPSGIKTLGRDIRSGKLPPNTESLPYDPETGKPNWGHK